MEGYIPEPPTAGRQLVWPFGSLFRTRLGHRCYCFAINAVILTFHVLSLTAVARKMVSERRTQTVLGPERGRDVRRRHVALLRRQPDGVLRDSATGRPVRQHGAAAATGSERDAGLHPAGAHHPR